MSTMTVQPELTALDRCDRCGSQAYVAVTLASGNGLLFCGHHWHQHEDVVLPLASSIHSEMEKLSS